MFSKKSWIIAIITCATTGLFAEGGSQPPTKMPNPGQQMANPTAQPTTTTPATRPVGNLQWYTNYQEALARAKAEKKPLLLFFTGSDWCGWCKKMENEILQTPDFAQTAGNSFIFVMLDFPMNKTLPQAIADQNGELKQKYGITGYPTVVILDSNENFIAETGYRSGGGKSYADYLVGLTKQ